MDNKPKDICFDGVNIWVANSKGNSVTKLIIETTSATTTPTPIAQGRIVLVNHNSPSGTPGSFDVTMSYGAQVGYPNGLKMTDGFVVDSGYRLAPGTYTVNETVPAGWQLEIAISDPSGGSLSSGYLGQVIVDLAPGETVTVVLYNTNT